MARGNYFKLTHYRDVRYVVQEKRHLDGSEDSSPANVVNHGAKEVMELAKRIWVW